MLILPLSANPLEPTRKTNQDHIDPNWSLAGIERERMRAGHGCDFRCYISRLVNSEIGK